MLLIPGILYAFAGHTTDIANLLGVKYYSGVGLSLLDIASVEMQLEILGVGGQISIGNFSVSANANLLGEFSMTFGWDTDLGNGFTRTDGFTIGINPRIVVIPVLLYRTITTGEPFRMPIPS